MNHSEYCKRIEYNLVSIADANQVRLRYIEGALAEKNKYQAQLRLDIQALNAMQEMVLQNIETTRKFQSKTENG